MEKEGQESLIDRLHDFTGKIIGRTEKKEVPRSTKKNQDWNYISPAVFISIKRTGGREVGKNLVSR